MWIVLDQHGSVPDPEYLVGFVMGLYLVYDGFGTWKTYHRIQKTPRMSDVLTDLTGNDDLLCSTHRRRRYTQSVRTVGSDVYVFGTAVPKSDGGIDAGQEDLLEIRDDPEAGEFLVADASERRLHDRFSNQVPLKLAGGLLSSTLCLTVVLTSL